MAYIINQNLQLSRVILVDIRINRVINMINIEFLTNN